jgi:hypothetical protein
MRTLFSYLVSGGILIGTVAAAVAAQSGPASQRGQKKEKAQAVIVEKKDHGRNGNGGDSTKSKT